MSEKLTKKKKKTRGDRVVTKISSYQVFTISWGTEQPGISFGVIFIFFFPTKIAGGRAHDSRGISPTPSP